MAQGTDEVRCIQAVLTLEGTPPRAVLDDVTLVIPTLGRGILEACLSSILTGNSWPGQLIVVDQGSSPKVAEWIAKLRYFGINTEHLPSRQRGRAAAVNRGIEHSATRFVAITDDDCLVDPNWLQSMADCLRGTPDCIVTGRVEAEGDEPVVALNPNSTSAIQRRPRLNFDTMCGGNMGISSAVITRVGLFDEDPCLRAAEDNEYAYRALRLGVSIVYAPGVLVRHYGWRNANERVTQYQSYARSHGGFYGKYLRRGDWFIAVRAGIHLLRALRRWVRGSLTANQELALRGRAYLTGLLPGIIAGWRSGRPS